MGEDNMIFNECQAEIDGRVYRRTAAEYRMPARKETWMPDGAGARLRIVFVKRQSRARP